MKFEYMINWVCFSFLSQFEVRLIIIISCTHGCELKLWSFYEMCFYKFCWRILMYFTTTDCVVYVASHIKRGDHHLTSYYIYCLYFELNLVTKHNVTKDLLFMLKTKSSFLPRTIRREDAIFAFFFQTIDLDGGSYEYIV